MHLLSTEDLEKRYMSKVVWEKKFGKIRLKKTNFCLRLKRNEWISLRRECIKSYFQNVTKKGLVTNKSFWNFIKPFLTNKSCHTQNDIILIDNGKVIVEESDLVETFNNHYINIVEKSSEQNHVTLLRTKIH